MLLFYTFDLLCINKYNMCGGSYTLFDVCIIRTAHVCFVKYRHFFQLLALTGKKGKILSNCIYIIGSIFMTYVGCYSGQRVIDHNTNITRKIYQVSFYKLSIKTQKALLLLTMKVMNPCHFSMMGTMVTSHKLFLNIYMLFTSEPNINLITKSLETTLPTVCFGSCYCNLLLKTAIMKKILRRIKCDWGDLANKPELKILKKYANVSKLSTMVIAISFYLYIAFLIFPSLLRILQYIFGIIHKTELILPVRFDYCMSNQMFFFTVFLYEYIGMCIIGMVGVANYSMFIAIIQHACGLFNIVIWKIDERFKKKQRNFNHPRIYNKSTKDEEWIVDIIKFYNSIDEFLFEVLTLPLNISEKLTKFNFVVGSMFVIYAYYHLGQKLTDHHTDVFMKFCQIPFYSLSLKTQKLLLFFIMRSMKSCDLSINGVFVISHYLFAAIYMLFTSGLNINAITKLLEITVPTVCCGFCFWNILSKTAIMKKIMRTIKCDWGNLANKPELKILKKYANVSKLSTMVIAISFYLHIAFLIFPSLLRILPYIFGAINKTELILPVRFDYCMSNQMFFFMALLYEYIGMFIVSTIGAANYSMFAAVIQHACGLFKIIIWKTDERFKKKQCNFDQSRIHNKFVKDEEWIVGIIKFYNDIDDCQIPFYSLSLKSQKLLLFFIMKSMKPCNLSMNGVFVISHYLLAAIMRKSFSFAMIYMLFTSEPNINLITKSLETTLPTMKKILRRIKCDWGDLANKPELKILKKYANVSKLSTMVIAISFYLYIAFLIFPSLLRILQYIFGIIHKTELILPVRFDYCMSNQIFFFLVLFYQYVGMCIVCMVGVANYSMFIAVIQHACALFNIIQCQIPYYTLSLKTQKLLLLLVMKTMRPCYLSVKGVVVVSHYTFAKLIQSSFSYAVVFYKLQ
ncbi:odorant receptor 46a-like isoform X1 [Vespula maculifrons]|uniref:Odorant receptor 46a-like isoform X1 n=1 Tax=Vespula maculifrons TaxID=7453 RepID=A0ABD2B459_VESMC